MPPEEKMQPGPPVTNNREKHQFEIHLGTELGLLTYQEHEGKIELVHTEVPKSYQGKGYANQLAKAALEYAKQNQLKVIPACRFVRAYLKRHPDVAHVI